MATKPTRFAQMGDTTEKVKAYTGIPKQLVVDTSKWKIHLMDGSTPGGYEVAMVADVTAGLAQKVDTAELETALKELIVEFGGTVPQ
ncbi:MAG: hypothetical protein KH315_15045 [Faecalibacterium prausnitzii]|uniref:Uncharacterized protein n=1 Tax=Faecalibacterium prausnitzii TaxID=853 RepID=A0A9E1GN44_9FIRM|nr:hypothetical protein [Faecalibacterium prausnitzii]